MKKLLTAAICGVLLCSGCQKPNHEENHQAPKREKAVSNQHTQHATNKGKTVKTDVTKDITKNGKKVEKKEPPFTLPDVVAKVNGKEIKKEEVMEKLTLLEKRFSQLRKYHISNKDRKQFAKNILQTIVRQELIRSYIAEKKIAVDDQEVNKMFEQRKSFFKKPGDFEAYLKRSGLTEQELKKSLKYSLLTQKLFEEYVFKEIKIDEAAIKAYFEKNSKKYVQEEQVKASHILVKVPAKATEKEKAEKRKKIEAILAKVKKGEDFEKLAKENSECPSSSRGGDLGFFGAHRMVKPFSEAAFALKDGAVSDVVETQFGYHIIKRTAHKAAKKLGLNDEISNFRGKKLVKDQIKETLEQGQKRQKAKDFYEQLKKQYHVELFI